MLDLPTPLSVNKTRRIDWASKGRIDAWVKSADALVMSKGRRPKPLPGRYEATIVLPEDSAGDLDNLPKMILDYARRIELVVNDSPRYMRRLILEFGDAPEGCRLILKSLELEEVVQCFWPTCGDSLGGVPRTYGHARKRSECLCKSACVPVQSERAGAG